MKIKSLLAVTALFCFAIMLAACGGPAANNTNAAKPGDAKPATKADAPKTDAPKTDAPKTEVAGDSINFHSKVELVQDFSNSRDIVERIFDLKADGMTVLNDAVFKAAEVLAARHEKRRAIIVLSDGADTQSKRSQDKALKAANAAGATIYTIDMSSPDATLKEKAQNQSALKSLAEKTGGTFVATPGGNGMRDAFKKIVEELGNQYTLAYSPKEAKKDGKFHSIEVTVARPNLTIRTRKGYNAPKK